jgi:hypothetical protein
VEDFIASNNFIKLNNNPTKKFNKMVLDTLKACPKTIKIVNRYTVMNPRPPILYSFPKIHKPENPIRPVVFFINAPVYKLAKFLNRHLPDLIKFKSPFSIKNSLDLISKIQNIPVPSNSKLISFDIKNLFHSIPVPELLPLIKKHLDIHIIDPITRIETMELLSLCLDQNF